MNNRVSQDAMFKHYRTINRIISIFMVPILSVLTLGLAICSFISFVGGVILTFQVKGLQMEFLPGYFLPPGLSLIVSLLFTCMLVVATVCCNFLLSRSIKGLKRKRL